MGKAGRGGLVSHKLPATHAKVRNKTATKKARKHELPRPARKQLKEKMMREAAAEEMTNRRMKARGAGADAAASAGKTKKRIKAEKRAKQRTLLKSRAKTGLMGSAALGTLGMDVSRSARAAAATLGGSSSSGSIDLEDAMGDAGVSFSAMKSFLSSVGHAGVDGSSSCDLVSDSGSSIEAGDESSVGMSGYSSDDDNDDDAAADDIGGADLRPRRPRTWDDGKSPGGGSRLPIVTRTGRVTKRSNVSMYALAPTDGSDSAGTASESSSDSDSDSDGNSSGSGSSDAGASKTKKKKQLSEAAARHQRERLLRKHKLDIAEGIELLLAAPEKHIDGLTVLLDLAKTNKDPAVQRYAIAGLTTVYKDILPDYRVRALTQAETSSGKLSKEVARVQGFETSLVASYQAFVQLIDSRMGRVLKAVNREDVDKVRRAALVDARLFVNSVCTLVVSKPRFNFTTDLIKWLIRGVNNKNPDISKQSHKALRELFEIDGEKEATLAAIGLVAAAIKARNYNGSPRLIHLFGSLKLLDAIPKAVSLDGQHRSIDDVLHPHLSHKAKKDLKAQRKRDKELAVREHEISKYERQLLQTDILSRIMLAYFRVLKNGQSSPLLPAVLSGLEKHAHLVNIEFTDDLFAALASVVFNTELPLLSRATAIRTAFGLVTGIGSAFTVDLKDFFIGLYQIVALTRDATASAEFARPNAVDSSTKSLLSTVVDNLAVAFKHLGRELSSPRVAALLKRMGDLALVTPVNYTIALLWQMRVVIGKSMLLHQLFDSEKTTMGVFEEANSDPHRANGLAATLYSVFALASSHWHPKVREIAAELAALAPVPVSQSAIQISKFIRGYDTSAGNFNPPIKPPPPHSLTRAIKKFAKRSGKAAAADRKWYYPHTRKDISHTAGPDSVAAPILAARVPPPASSTLFSDWMDAQTAASDAAQAAAIRSASRARLLEIKRLHTVFSAVRKRRAQNDASSSRPTKKSKRR